jgi:hypothetical protein
MNRTLAFAALFALVLGSLGQTAGVAAKTVTKTTASKTTTAKTTTTTALSKSEAIAKARAFFARYVQLEHSFDPAMADLYADKAVLMNKRIYPDGKVSALQIPALRYKHVLRTTMADAKRKGDLSTYSKESYTPEGDKVRIKVTRYSVLKKYSSPMSQLVGPDAQGNWVIYEETSESRI